MECKKYESRASEYLDQRLDEKETIEYRSHLSACNDCFVHLTETEAVSLAIKRSQEPEVPLELHSYIMTAIEQREAKEISIDQRFFEWLLRLNPRPLSYAMGAVVSVFMFTLILSAVKPVPAIGSTFEAARQADTIPAVTSPKNEYVAYNAVPLVEGLDTAAPLVEGLDTGEMSYELPRVLVDSSLVSFSHTSYEQRGSEGIAMLVEVSPDGRGELVEVLGDDPPPPQLVEQLWWSLSKRTFQPAMVEGRPIPTRIVVLVEQINVRG